MGDQDTPDDGRDHILNSFIQVTGCDEGTAQVHLELSTWDLGIALERYYSDMEVNTVPGGSEDRSASPELVDTNQSSHSHNEPPKQKSRFTTLADLKPVEMSDSSDDDEAQAYYAGGSEHSGQQVLGPPSRKKKKDIIADILKSVQQIGAEVIEPGRSSSSTSRESFAGTGYRLGQTESDTQVVPSALKAHEDTSTVTLKLWKEGFTVDDGELREYENPDNKQFLDSVRQGLIPPELTSGVGNSVVQLNLEDRHHDSYTPSSMPKIKPFSGQGHLLGRPTPLVILETSQEEGEEKVEEDGKPTHGISPAEPAFEVDDTKPKTTIAIRLPDGSRLQGTFNHTHTVGDIRTFINRSHPQYAAQPYILQTTIPIVELEDNSLTVGGAGLFNSVLVMKLQK